MLALLDVVRLALLHPPKPEAATVAFPPSFEKFRSTRELLEARSKEFVKQSGAVIGQQRAFSETLRRLNANTAGMLFVMVVLGLASERL